MHGHLAIWPVYMYREKEGSTIVILTSIITDVVRGLAMPLPPYQLPCYVHALLEKKMYRLASIAELSMVHI